jgi:hypothetical protein
MLLVRLMWRGIQAGTLRTAWRRAISLPTPALPGLIARQWQLDGAGVLGFYLFVEDERWTVSFLANPSSDPAYAVLASQLGTAKPEPAQVLQLPSTLKIERPVFVVAAPRSGSTLLFDLLAQAPGIWTQGGEGQGAVDGIAGLHYAQRGYSSDRLTEEELTPNARACLHAGWRCGLRDRQGDWFNGPVNAESGRNPRLLDKTTEHSLRVSFLARACPDAQFVFLHRDARQNVSSLMRAWCHGGFVRIPDLPGWPERAWCFLLPPGWRELRGRSMQEVATAQWEAANYWALYDLEALDASRWTSVEYNDLVAHPSTVLLRLCKFLDIEIDTHLEAHLARPLQVSATAISPPSTIKWRSHRELDVPSLEVATRATSARLRSLRTERGRPAAASPPAVMPPSPARFACHLTEVLVDEPHGACSSEETTDSLVVEPSMRLQLGATIPLGLATATRFRDRFLADHPILWTRDPFTQAYLPFWVPRNLAHFFATFEPGAPPPHCPDPWRARLYATGIIASSAERDLVGQKAAATRKRLSLEFAAGGYCVISGVLATPHTAALARYYRELIASGWWRLGDDQVAQRHGWHNESVARFFHQQLTEFVGALVGRPVCPSYAYVSAYRQGAELEPHVDRKQCEYTLSVIIDETGGRAADWPLWFLDGNGRSSVTLQVGEGVLFRGHDLPHWREASPQPGLALSTLLLHYVPAQFRETLD